MQETKELTVFRPLGPNASWPEVVEDGLEQQCAILWLELCGLGLAHAVQLPADIVECQRVAAVQTCVVAGR
jgi:hypothetical protein